MVNEPRPRRRVRRIADVDYDRTADSPASPLEDNDADRVVELDEFADEQLTGKEFYEQERPPHHGAE